MRLRQETRSTPRAPMRERNILAAICSNDTSSTHVAGAAAGHASGGYRRQAAEDRVSHLVLSLTAALTATGMRRQRSRWTRWTASARTVDSRLPQTTP